MQYIKLEIYKVGKFLSFISDIIRPYSKLKKYFCKMKSPEDLYKDKKNNKKTKPSTEQIINQGIQFHLQGNIREATKYYQHLISEGCNDHRVFSNYGAILYGIGKLQDAANWFRKSIELNPDFANAHSNLGNILRDQGDLKEAEVYTRKAIELDPDFANAHSNLGNILRDQGDLKEAEVCTHKAIELNPNFAMAYSNLGNILRDQGDLKEAEVYTRKAIELDPDFANAHSNLGNILRDQGDLKEAEVCTHKAIELNPNFAMAYSNLGNIQRDQGNLKEAEVCTRKAIELNPNFAMAYSNLGNIRRDQGDLKEAEEYIRKAIEINPDFAEAYSNLGIILRDQGDLKEAEIYTRKSIELNSDFAMAYSNLGNILRDQGDLHNAEVSTRKAIEINPAFLEAHSNLGIILRDLGDLRGAEVSTLKAIEIYPFSSEVHSNMGNILSDLGKFQEAEFYYRKAIEIKPDDPNAHINLGGIYKVLGNFNKAFETYVKGCSISPRNSTLFTAVNLFFQDIYEDTEQIHKARSRYSSGIKKIERNIPKLDTPRNNLDTDMFWLAYQNMKNDKEILVTLGRTMQALYKIGETDLKQSYTRRESKNDKLCIGICSDFLCSHTIGKLYKGIIQAFKQSEINVTILRGPGAKSDDFSRKIDSYSWKSIRLPLLTKEAVKMIKNEIFDALFYPDIGMSSYTYSLALHRLAPVQVTSWGHPNTTGLNTIDYFISSELIEPINAQALYKEQLIELRKLPCIYAKPNSESRRDLLKTFHLPCDKTLIGIPQSLFKFHPDYDDVLEKISEKLPDMNYVIIEGRSKSQTERLKKRWKTTAPNVLKKTIFLERMSLEDYLSLLDTVDLLLDPIYFGSGNSFYEAMAFGTPFITMPGNYMRCRIVAGAYKQMKLKNAPVASNIQEYIDLAIKLTKNSELRIQIKEESKIAAQQYLFNDKEAANEIIEFLCSRTRT